MHIRCENSPCEGCIKWKPYDNCPKCKQKLDYHRHKWNHKKRICETCGKSLDKAIDEISEAMRKAASDPKVIERGEELERMLSHMTPEDLLRRFDI
jgi:hypothetical protein